MSLDFLDTYRPVVTLSEIRCDADGCTKCISVPNDIDDAQAASIARASGWTAQMGTQRWSHHCVRHAEVKL